MPTSSSSPVLVVGAGIIGLAAAWQLAQRGHPVRLIDPALARTAAGRAGEPQRSGSEAALGLLMGRVFQRSSGRAWRLRQRSQELWPRWLSQLEGCGHRLPRRQGLLLLAADDQELARQERIALARERQGIPMQRLGPEALQALRPALPGRPLGGLLSPQDGQIDPGPLLQALRCEALRAGVEAVPEAVLRLERGRRWRVHLAGGGQLQSHWLVLALGLATQDLLAGLGHALPLGPVLGQALELELAADPGWTWPAPVQWRGTTLLPRQDREAPGRRLWLGATLEPGETASPAALEQLCDLAAEAPAWLREATVVQRWQGVRCRPLDRPAPVLEEPEAGLLVAGGHYRNGVLLAPASADWLCERIAAAEPAETGR